MSGSIVKSGSGIGPSGDPAPTAPLQAGLLQFLTGTYNLTPGDNNKYLVCSGGSWPLGLPNPAVGLSYQVRNDQGISGVTGTITLTPVNGTIDGLATLALLPGQQCTIYTDGTNWRTFGLQRVAVIGAGDITSAVANQVILLPVGYRLFEIDLYNLVPVTTNSALQWKLSSDGGNTFFATFYYDATIYNNAAATVAYSYGINQTVARLSPVMRGNAGDSGEVQIKINPGNGSRAPTWFAKATGFDGVNNWQSEWNIVGAYYGTPAPVINAVQIIYGSGNIAAMSFVVKGIV